MNGYRILIAGDVSERDGLAVELEDEYGLTVAEIFRDDEGGRHTIRFFDDKPLSLEVMAWYMDAAQRELFQQ